MHLVENKKILLQFEPLETFNAGMELLGTEVKALRAHQGKLEGSYIVIRGGEAFLVGASITPLQKRNASEKFDPARARRLLLSKKELERLFDAEKTKGLTIIPLMVYNNKRYLKLRIAIARGKGKRDKREALKKREAVREIARVMKKG